MSILKINVKTTTGFFLYGSFINFLIIYYLVLLNVYYVALYERLPKAIANGFRNPVAFCLLLTDFYRLKKKISCC